MMKTPKLKLGLLLDSYEAPAWLFRSLERIVNGDSAEIVAVFLNESGPQAPVSSGHGGFAYRLFNRIDEKLFRREPDAFKPLDLRKLLSGVPALALKPLLQGEEDAFAPEDVARVRELGLDILVKLGFRRLGGKILSAARYGVWFYQPGDNTTIRGGPPGFWEVAERRPATGATLMMADETAPGGRAIYRSQFLTYPFSPARNRQTSSWSAASFLPRQLDLLYRQGEARFWQETARYNTGLDLYDGRQYQAPGNFESLKFYSRFFARQLFELYQRAFRLDTWYLMFALTNSSALAFADFKKIVPPKDRFWADPQVIWKDGKYFIFIEELLYQNHKGHLAVIEMDSQGSWKEPVPVLETGYHLSYPFVFEHNQKYYMVPETGANRTIDLYECVEFPTRWKFKLTLMENVTAKDTTLFFRDGKWWLFTGITENPGAAPEVELFLYYADDLFSTDWKAHPLNPLVSDVTNARPAGRLFVQDGKVYRPSQDCSRNYGYGFNINEILCLSETDYLEKKVAAVKPNWDNQLIATHTCTRADGLFIIDCLTRRAKFF
jgi:hypothetical protein